MVWVPAGLFVKVNQIWCWTLRLIVSIASSKWQALYHEVFLLVISVIPILGQPSVNLFHSGEVLVVDCKIVDDILATGYRSTLGKCLEQLEDLSELRSVKSRPASLKSCGLKVVHNDIFTCFLKETKCLLFSFSTVIACMSISKDL